MHSLSLEGQVAIVTGSMRGIGKAIAIAFAEAGADVIVCDAVVEDGQLEAVAKEIRELGRRSLPVQTDITRKSDVDRLVQRVIDEFAVIDILVNNAGIIIRRLLIETSEDEWEKVMDTNLKGYYLCSVAVGKRMMERKKGCIINMASTAGERVVTDTGCYCVSKAGVIMLTKLLALELASYNIRVNAIGPGMTKTDLNRPLWRDPEILKGLKQAAIPIGRLAETREIASTALFLASDASSYITGTTVFVDGGWLA